METSGMFDTALHERNATDALRHRFLHPRPVFPTSGDLEKKQGLTQIHTD